MEKHWACTATQNAPYIIVQHKKKKKKAEEQQAMQEVTNH